MTSSELRPNRGFGDFVKHVFTGKDYYTTSTGVKIKCDRDYGSVFEDENGGVIADRLQNAVIKGTDNDDSITVHNSTVNKVSGKDGDDTLKLIGSTVQEAFGGRGEDSITALNSQIGTIEGGSGDDQIVAYNSEVGSIFSDVDKKYEDGLWGFVRNGNDEIHAYKSNIGSIDAGGRSDLIDAQHSTIDSVQGGNLFKRNLLLNTDSEIGALSHTKVVDQKAVYQDLVSVMQNNSGLYDASPILGAQDSDFYLLQQF